MSGRLAFKAFKGKIITAPQLIRHRNIMLGLPILYRSNPSINNDIPFGYEHDPDREGWLKPVQKQLETLYWAKVLQRRSGLREIARWITNETGRKVTETSLRSIFLTRPPLSTYLLPLHDRISIATSATEEEAKALSPKGIGWNTRQNVEARTKYTELRRQALSRKNEAKRAKASE